MIKGKHTGLSVALETQHDFGSSVPAGGYIFGHVPRIFLWVHRETSGQTKITNLQLAIGVDEQISRLQVSMKHVRRVNILETAQNLVDEGLEMGIGERLTRPNDGGQVAFHELYMPSALYRAWSRAGHTLVEVALVEVVRARNVHIVETCYLQQTFSQQVDGWAGAGAIRCGGLGGVSRQARRDGGGSETCL